MNKVKFIDPPKKCDNCSDEITLGFSDALSPRHRQWGNFCPPCASQLGVAYGTGLGQRYQRNNAGEYWKVEG